MVILYAYKAQDWHSSVFPKQCWGRSRQPPWLCHRQLLRFYRSRGDISSGRVASYFLYSKTVPWLWLFLQKSGVLVCVEYICASAALLSANIAPIFAKSKARQHMIYLQAFSQDCCEHPVGEIYANPQLKIRACVLFTLHIFLQMQQYCVTFCVG